MGDQAAYGVLAAMPDSESVVVWHVSGESKNAQASQDRSADEVMVTLQDEKENVSDENKKPQVEAEMQIDGTEHYLDESQSVSSSHEDHVKKLGSDFPSARDVPNNQKAAVARQKKKAEANRLLLLNATKVRLCVFASVSCKVC